MRYVVRRRRRRGGVAAAGAMALSLPLLTWVASTVLPAGLEAGVGGGGPAIPQRERERERLPAQGHPYGYHNGTIFWF